MAELSNAARNDRKITAKTQIRGSARAESARQPAEKSGNSVVPWGQIRGAEDAEGGKSDVYRDAMGRGWLAICPIVFFFSATFASLRFKKVWGALSI
jgi:hypothetical protein